MQTADEIVGSGLGEGPLEAVTRGGRRLRGKVNATYTDWTVVKRDVMRLEPTNIGPAPVDRVIYLQIHERRCEEIITEVDRDGPARGRLVRQ